MYEVLGKEGLLQGPQETEFSNRVAGVFSKHKQELTDERRRLKHRLRLFDAVITSSLLYGCEAWTL